MRYKYDKTPLSGEISDYDMELRLHKVDETKWEPFWDELVKTNHYLGYESVIGSRIKYIITFGKQIIGAISFCSAAYQLGPRDNYIGWDEETRLKMLPHLVCNNRFLILPWIHIQNLASKVLSMSLRYLRLDWEKQYEVVPFMVETFVDKAQYLGTCYKASNWIHLGITRGYGKIGKDFVYHGRKKDLYVYIIERQFARQFKPDITRLHNEREELAAMINGTPMWYPSLLKEVGITANPAEQIRQRFIDHLMRFTSFLGRKEHKLHLASMVQGLLSDLDRKSIEPIAIAFEGIDGVRNLTNFMSRSKWDDTGMFSEYREELSELLSNTDGMITGDETDFPKKGNESIGVARQYCGNTGKIDNCQAGVMAGYASTNGYGLIDYELYMPESWFDEDHAIQRNKCKVPTKLEFKTKNKMLQDMINKAIRSGKFPAKYVGVDSSFGSDNNFLDSLPDNIIYFADVRSNCYIFASRPDVFVPPYSGTGRKPIKGKTKVKPLTVKELLEQSKTPWERVVLGIGSKGPVITEDKCLPVVEVRDGLPGKDIWLYVRKLENGTLKYALCNAPANAPIEDIRKPALMRWSIEQCFGECKNYLGMDHYESRSWDAWHRHILLTLIAHLFIIKLRIEFSRTPNAPNVTPYIETPVNLDDYLQAFEQMQTHQQISHPDILIMPKGPQQFMTIGLIQKLVSSTFPKVGAVVDEINYLMYKAMSAFESHSLAAIDKALLAHNSTST